MATLRQIEKAYGPFDSSDEVYCLCACERCGEDTEPYNGRFLTRAEDGTYHCPVKAGDEDMGDWFLFGAACAKRVEQNDGVMVALTSRERRIRGW